MKGENQTAMFFHAVLPSEKKNEMTDWKEEDRIVQVTNKQNKQIHHFVTTFHPHTVKISSDPGNRLRSVLMSSFLVRLGLVQHQGIDDIKIRGHGMEILA